MKRGVDEYTENINMIKVSVVMAVYNGETYLREAIESILKQSEKNFEFIIVDDGSKDGTATIIEEFKGNDMRIIALTVKHNMGLVYCLNKGISIAKGEYVARMDADDISLPHRFERQLSFMKETGISICGAWAEAINASGDKLYTMTYPPKAEEIKLFSIKHNPFIHSTVMIRRDVLNDVGGYSKMFKHVEDYELWTRILYKYVGGNISEVLLKYRIHEKQITSERRRVMLVKGVLVRILAIFRWVSIR